MCKQYHKEMEAVREERKKKKAFHRNTGKISSEMSETVELLQYHLLLSPDTALRKTVLLRYKGKVHSVAKERSH